MKKIIIFLTLFGIIILTNCSKDDSLDLEYKNLKSLVVGDYEFQVPSNFRLIEREGIDSSIGEVVGSGITFVYDFGYYSGPSNNVNLELYHLYEDVINNHEVQIIVSKSPNYNIAQIHIYDLNGFSEVINSYLSLSMGTTGELSDQQQELAVHILNSVQPIN